MEDVLAAFAQFDNDVRSDRTRALRTSEHWVHALVDSSRRKNSATVNRRVSYDDVVPEMHLACCGKAIELLETIPATIYTDEELGVAAGIPGPVLRKEHTSPMNSQRAIEAGANSRGTTCRVTLDTFLPFIVSAALLADRDRNSPLGRVRERRSKERRCTVDEPRTRPCCVSWSPAAPP
jgi:hypothetical protein